MSACWAGTSMTGQLPSRFSRTDSSKCSRLQGHAAQPSSTCAGMETQTCVRHTSRMNRERATCMHALCNT
eukprot:1081555-Pelagomonas_calceolata.AAC.1